MFVDRLGPTATLKDICWTTDNFTPLSVVILITCLTDEPNNQIISPFGARQVIFLASLLPFCLITSSDQPELTTFYCCIRSLEIFIIRLLQWRKLSQVITPHLPSKINSLCHENLSAKLLSLIKFFVRHGKMQGRIYSFASWLKLKPNVKVFLHLYYIGDHVWYWFIYF